MVRRCLLDVVWRYQQTYIQMVHGMLDFQACVRVLIFIQFATRDWIFQTSDKTLLRPRSDKLFGLHFVQMCSHLRFHVNAWKTFLVFIFIFCFFFFSPRRRQNAGSQPVVEIWFTTTPSRRPQRCKCLRRRTLSPQSSERVYLSEHKTRDIVRSGVRPAKRVCEQRGLETIRKHGDREPDVWTTSDSVMFES